MTSAKIAKRDAAFGISIDLNDDDSIQELITRKSGLFIVSLKKIIRIKTPDEVDPLREADDAPTEQSLYLPHGSQDLLVARTILQTAKISEIFFAKNSTEFEALQDASWEVMNSLISLRFVHERLSNQIDSAVIEIEKDIESYRSGPSPKPLPIVPYFEIEFRSFVNEVRRALNKITELFRILTDSDIGAGQFHRALEWAKKTKGANSELSEMLERDQRWIRTWIDMRISIEHPKQDKYIETLNFSLEADRKIRLPTWRFIHPDYNMAKPQNLLECFEICINNILKFYEDLLVVLTEGHQSSGIGVEFSVIEESERDLNAPFRWKFQIRNY